MEDVEEVEVMTIGEEEIDQEEVEDVETAVIVGIAEIAGKDVVVEKDHKLVNLKPTEHLSSNEY